MKTKLLSILALCSLPLSALAAPVVGDMIGTDAETAKAAIQYRIKVRTEQMPQIDDWLRDHKG